MLKASISIGPCLADKLLQQALVPMIECELLLDVHPLTAVARSGIVRGIPTVGGRLVLGLHLPTLTYCMYYERRVKLIKLSSRQNVKVDVCRCSFAGQSRTIVLRML